MSRLTIPSTQSLIAFEQVARTRSFTRAAQALNLTQGAVSKQVSSLETLFGVKFFARSREGLVLTQEGARYLAAIEEPLRELLNAGERAFRPLGLPVPLRVRGLATLNDKWLLPRIGQFIQKHPAIRIEFSTVLLATSRYVSPAELEIRFGSGDWDDVDSHYLVGAECLVVTSRDFLKKHARSTSCVPAEVLDWPRCDHMQALAIWSEFMKTYDLAGRPLPQAAGTYEVYSVLISAVVNSLAAGLVPKCLVETEILSGALVNPAGLRVTNPQAYYVCWPRKVPLRGEAKEFLKWLIKEAETVTSISDSSHPATSHQAG